MQANTKATIVLILTVSTVGISFGSKYSGGSGIMGNPYQIGNVSDWQDLMATPSDWAVGNHFVLTEDLDLSGVALTPIGDEFVYGSFGGSFDGNGHTIKNATLIGTVSGIGLFGSVGTQSVIRNLSLVNATVVGVFRTGCLAGISSGQILNCSATGYLTSTDSRGGGLVGENEGHLSGCWANVVVNGTTAGEIGGLAGRNAGTVADCYALGAVSGDQYIGGLIGINFSGYANTTRSYSVGQVTGNAHVGGLCGYNESTITHSFWDTQTSGQPASAGGQGKTTAELQRRTTFTAAGWDFAPTDADGDPAVWFTAWQGYPRLRWEQEIGVNELLILAGFWLADGCESTEPCADADWHLDQSVNLADFARLSQSWKSLEMRMSAPVVADSFETGDFFTLPWQNTSPRPWTIVFRDAYEGLYSAKSGSSSKTFSVLTLTVEAAGLNTLQFAVKIDAAVLEGLSFSIDGVVQETWTGQQDWQIYTCMFTPGVRTLSWTFSSAAINPGAAWIDDIQILKQD